MNMFASMVATTISVSSFAAEISVRTIQPGTYELVLTNPTALSEGEARAQVAKAASSVCKGSGVILGKWKFASSEVVNGAAAQQADSFRFVQEVSCTLGAQASREGERVPILRSAAEVAEAQSEVKLKSETYFKLIAGKRLDEAVKQVAIARMGLSEDRWKSNKLSFEAMAGEPIQISIVKITVYDNPASAPEPGIYVAADYSNVFREVPVHCGYLMWHRPVGGEFQITREETGHITSEQLKSIPDGQLPEIKRRLRCPAS